MDEPCEWPWYGEAATLDWAADYPLHDAAEQGDATLVRALLHSRANPSLAEPQRGWTPLQYGAACGHHAVCQALLAAGVSLLEDDPEAELACPPLLLAFNSDSWPLTHLLLKELKRRGQLSEAGRVLFARCAGRPPDAAALAVARTTSRAPAAAAPTAAHAALRHHASGRARRIQKRSRTRFTAAEAGPAVAASSWAPATASPADWRTRACSRARCKRSARACAS